MTLKEKQERLKKALQYSPLGVSVYAWVFDEESGLYVKENGQQDNHWCTLYGYKKGEYWKIFDTYDLTRKRLVWDYPFGCAKRYWLKKKVEQSWFEKIINFFKNLLK